MISATQDSNPASSLLASLSTSRTVVKDGASETQDRFLKLLVTQMKNQDPLNPLDNAEVTTQMAQLSTVSGIDKLNSTLLALSANMTAAQSVSAANMIGHGVLVPGSAVSLVNGQALGGVDLVKPADNVTVTIYGPAGNIVRMLQYSAQDAGILPFAWDGKNDAGEMLADGSYTFTATGLLSDKQENLETLSFGLVNAVTPGARGALLDVSGLGSFDLSLIRQIL